MFGVGQAVKEMLDGKKVRRSGWNGKGMWLCFMPPMTIPAGMVNERTRHFVPPGDLSIGGYFVMWTAQGIWQPGWNASTQDLQAIDWEVVE